jgi:hypothetical protein
MIKIDEWLDTATISNCIFKKQDFIITFFKQSAYYFCFINDIN